MATPPPPPTSIAITVANNANQSIKTALVLQLGSSAQPAVQQILACAKNKLRLKKAQLLFHTDGQPLTNTSAATLTKGSTVLASCGEPFVGTAVAENAETNAPARVPAPVLLLADHTFIDSDALQQLNHTATLPGVIRAVGYPDLCPGLRFPVGASFLVKDRVYPELIGGDIGCGMSLYLLPTLSSDARVDKLVAKLSRLEGPWSGSSAARLDAAGISSTAAHDLLLGTIGGGNHFAELQVVERVEDEAAFTRLGLRRDRMALLVHSGSRSLGKSVLEKTLERAGDRVKDGVSFEAGSKDMEEYMEKHDHACAWARVNREVIAERFLALLLGGDEAAGGDWMQERAQIVIDIHHNNVEIKKINGDSVWVHRKGAAPSDRGIVPIPGSRGAFTYLVEPYGPQDENAFSLPHGAGRKWTRTKAHAILSQKSKRNESGGKGDFEKTELGGTVICEDSRLLLEEAPEAYKAIETVVEDVKEFARVVAVMRPVLTYKFMR
ncbi:hypothetical protein CcCBS67573_g01186 [Chytriomyces confervae]|uniref:3'-phosphate/5'-hydroxy nucleic acid ligase n=1 Tax=Chytriomyces confervae TaxID=246404 RepID=A0A507FMS1_9FUNG|nr:hypothetical protein HDU80_000308 [Chytriomyces hyalinus]TPX77552.1 hypothetical protein CcCBS67573_g01186 [Chytriomyces confervae]